MTDAPQLPTPQQPTTGAYARMTWMIVISIGAVVMLTGALVLWSWRRPLLGLQNGRLRPCPSSPNCVCSQDADPEHAIEPLTFSGDAADAWTRLSGIIAAEPNARILQSDDACLHAEFWTPVLRFVDDVEFLLDRPAGTIHVRSASRVGHSDLGANRKRVEALRRRFETAAD
ncbi:MAG: DUF1499 domain-containing protein [Planctomycetaceae bacterium]|nr:DUF1499 domain-containing protein [Planctomycetaceae bacterium]